MKVTLEFNLPEDKEDYELAYNGVSYYLVLVELDNELRRMYKYEDKTHVEIEKVREIIRNLCDERKVKI